MKDIVWDYKIGDDIQYFDNTKSYELTGYIPINDKSGLDFNPKWFTEDGERFNATGHYCSAPWGSIDFSEYWKGMLNKCQNGVTSHGYRLTGYNIFFLNFWRMQLPSDSEDNNSPAVDGFPAFLVFQYETFHYIDLCIKLNKNIIFMKARSMGFTEMMGAIIACDYTVRKGSRSTITAATEKYVNGLRKKVWNEFDFLNIYTDGGFKHLRMKFDRVEFKRASQVDSNGSEIVAPKGWMSEVDSVVSDVPDKLRSDRADKIFYEESGSNPNLEETWIKGESLVTRRGKKCGILFAWGTGGDKGEKVAGLKKMTYNPLSNNVLPHRNNYTTDGEYQMTCFFQPCWRNAVYVDDRGWVSEEEGKKEFIKKRELYKNDPKKLMRECAENCFTLEEAFSEMGEGGFPEEVRELASEQKVALTMGQGRKIRKGRMEWTYNNMHEHTGYHFVDDPSGHVYIAEMPISDANGNKYSNLYIAGIDSIDMGKGDSSTADNKTSDFCIVIKRRVFGLHNEGYVAYYKDRPRDIREAYETAYLMMCLYNCKANIEYTRITIVNHFKLKKWDNMFVRRPKSAMPDGTRTRRKLIGTPAVERVIKHELELICNFVFDEGDIPFPEFCQQICDYTYTSKRKYDIIAAMCMAEIADEDISFKLPKTVSDNESKDGTRLIGYYIGEDGYKKYGVIPDKVMRDYDNNRIANNYSWLHGEEVQHKMFDGYSGVK